MRRARERREERIWGQLEAQWDALQEAPAKHRQRCQVGDESFRKTGRCRVSGEGAAWESSLQDSRDGEIGEKRDQSGAAESLRFYRRQLSRIIDSIN